MPVTSATSATRPPSQGMSARRHSASIPAAAAAARRAAPAEISIAEKAHTLAQNRAMDIPKNLPVKQIYTDVAQPAAKEVGKALADTVRAARFLLAPVEYVAAWRDRWQRYLKRISEKVPGGNLKPADPEIAGPVLLQLLHAREDGLQAEMFLNLLARAVDEERANEAHPAYGQIIAQLHPDEALILYYLKKKWYPQVQSAEMNPDRTFQQRIEVSNDFPTRELAYPENFYAYMDHLYHLGIAWIRQIGNQEIVFGGEPKVQTGVTIRNAIELMGGFGSRFAAACVPDDLPRPIAPSVTKKSRRAGKAGGAKGSRR